MRQGAWWGEGRGRGARMTRHASFMGPRSRVDPSAPACHGQPRGRSPQPANVKRRSVPGSPSEPPSPKAPPADTGAALQSQLWGGQEPPRQPRKTSARGGGTTEWKTAQRHRQGSVRPERWLATDRQVFGGQERVCVEGPLFRHDWGWEMTRGLFPGLAAPQA